MSLFRERGAASDDDADEDDDTIGELSKLSRLTLHSHQQTSPSPFIYFNRNDTWTGQPGIQHALTVAHSKQTVMKTHKHYTYNILHTKLKSEKSCKKSTCLTVHYIIIVHAWHYQSSRVFASYTLHQQLHFLSFWLTLNWLILTIMTKIIIQSVNTKWVNGLTASFRPHVNIAYLLTNTK